MGLKTGGTLSVHLRQTHCLSRLPLEQELLASVGANGASLNQPGAMPQVIHGKRAKG